MTVIYKPMACGFHSHTDFSLDGGSTVEAKIKNAAKLGRVADCVTDHGIMSALGLHWMASEKLAKDKKNPVKCKSIHGIEAYIFDPHRAPTLQKNGKLAPHYMHLTIHFKTAEAYQYLCKLTPLMEERAITRGGERKPLLYLHELEPISGQITLGSGCLVGPVQKNILLGRSDWARENYIRLRELAGPGNFFVEVFPHIIDKEWQRPIYDKRKVGKSYVMDLKKPGEFIKITETKRDANPIDPPFPLDPCLGSIDIQKDPNLFVRTLAAEFGDPIVISLDDHYACHEDNIVQEVRLGNGLDKWKFYGNYASHSSEHCADQLIKQLGVEPKEIEQWIDNSYQFVELFDKYKMETAKDRWLMPTAQMVYPDLKTSTVDKLREMIDKYGMMPKPDHPEYQVYKDRLEYEISVLAHNKVADFLPYFFVIEDATSWARANGVMYNTRGSAGGSLVGYCLKLSITNPITYGLPFERFITTGRIDSGTLPDWDSDWPEKGPIMAYLSEKYGNRVAGIATEMMMRLKSSILDCERAMTGSIRVETKELTKGLKGADQGMSDRDWLYGYADKTTGAVVEGFLMSDHPYAEKLRQYTEENPAIWSAVEKCIGITKNRGLHAGGVVITPGPVQDYFPLIMTKMGLATAFNMKAVEYAGGVKYDFLGVSTLKAMAISMKALKEEKGIDIEWGEFPHDPDVYTNVIHSGNLNGIFQLNTSTVAPYVKDIKPKSIQDIATLTALIRPGALDAPSPDPSDEPSETAATYFVKCAKGLRQPYYIHPDMKAFTDYTHGVLVFQEQSLEAFRILAGYSFEEAEAVRRGIGKKDKDLLNLHSNILKQRCVERGWTPEQAERLFKTIEASARYSFNKSHSASYAIVAYNGSWLKHTHPLYFWKGILSINTDDHETLRECMDECHELLLPIDIIKSSPSEWMVEGDKIRPPLSVLKGCGDKSVTNIKRFIEQPLEGLVLEDETEEEAPKPESEEGETEDE